MANNIQGKVIVVTGASSGLGEAAARLRPWPVTTTSTSTRSCSGLRTRTS